MTLKKAVLLELRKLGQDLEDALTLVHAMYASLRPKKKKAKKKK